MQNVINTLCDYEDKNNGPMDSFSGCTTLLCQIKDNKEIGAGFVWSPQRWDLKRGHKQELDNFSLFINYFVNDWPKDKAYFIASWIARSSNPDIAVPTNWTHRVQLPVFPYGISHDENDEDFQEFLIFAHRKP